MFKQSFRRSAWRCVSSATLWPWPRKATSAPPHAHQATDISSALALAAAGFGVCPAPESVTQINWPDLRFLELQGVDALSSVNCIYSTHSRSPILLRFLEVLRHA